MRPGCAPEIRQLTVSVPALPSEYSILRIASPAVLPGMFGLDASARSQRTSPVTVYVPLPVTASLAFRVSQFPPPVAALDVPPPPAGATNVKRSDRSEEHTSELQSRLHLVCRLLLEKKKKTPTRSR